MISPTDPFGPAGCARWRRAGPTGRWKASWTRLLTPRGLIRWRFGFACWMALGATPDRRQTPSAARGGRPRGWRGAAAKVGWGGPMPKGAGLGVATSFGQEREMPTWVACIARVRVDRTSGRVTVETLTLVVDAGTIVHPDGAQ